MKSSGEFRPARFRRVTCAHRPLPDRIRRLPTLLKTFFDIAVLRKGPDALPVSWLVFYVAFGLWLAGILVMAAVVPGLSVADMATDVVGWTLSIALFAAVILGMGFRRRLPQGIGAIVGSSTIILYAQVLVAGVLLPLDAADVAGLCLELLLIWSIFVNGRILAATVNIQPFVGVAISVIVYILRYLSSFAMAPPS